MGAKRKKEFIQNRQRERSIVTMAPNVAAEISSGSDLYMSILYINKAGYTATEVACGWAGAIFEVARPFGQEQ